MKVLKLFSLLNENFCKKQIFFSKQQIPFQKAQAAKKKTFENFLGDEVALSKIKRRSYSSVKKCFFVIKTSQESKSNRN